MIRVWNLKLYTSIALRTFDKKHERIIVDDETDLDTLAAHTFTLLKILSKLLIRRDSIQLRFFNKSLTDVSSNIHKIVKVTLSALANLDLK